MNIETLKCASGAYRSAKVGDILKMLRADHVTHLQTSRGTIAIRPGVIKLPFDDVQRGWTVDRSTGNAAVDRTQSKWFTRQEQRRLIKAVLMFLNGKLHSFEATDDVIVEANQAGRDGYVLAVIGNRVLVEYEMPAGTSALVFFEAVGDQLYRLNTVPHRNLNQTWIDAMHDQGGADYWIGKGQRMSYAMEVPVRSPIAA